MIKLKKIDFRKNVRNIFAIVEKEVYLETRYKSIVITRLLDPLIQILVMIFIFGIIFSIQDGYLIGYWNAGNYVLFILIAFCLQVFRPITTKYYQSFIQEKYWNTLSATLIAPINKFTLLMGILVSWVILNSISFIVVFVIALIFFPISIIYFLFFLLAFMCVMISFASVGLFIGVYGISNENFGNYFHLIVRFIFLFTCINYPREIFPGIIQFYILFNPLYYLIDSLRLIWYFGIDPVAAAQFITPLHFIIFISFTILMPIIAIIFFNRVYKKYGITGY